MEISKANNVPFVFQYASAFFPTQILNGEFWAVPPTDVNTQTAAFFISANLEYFESASAQFNVGDEDFSYGGWIQRGGAGSPAGVMTKHNNTGNQRSYQMLMQGIDTTIVTGLSSDGTAANNTVLDTNISFSNTNLIFIVSIYDSVNDLLKCVVLSSSDITYPNIMSAIAQTGGAFAGSTALLNLGRREDGFYWNNRMDDMFFTKKRLSMAELLAIYNNDNGLPFEDWATKTGTYPVAQNFDGVTDAFNIDSTIPAVTANTVGTISAWVKMPDATPTARSYIVAYGSGLNSNFFFNIESSPSGAVRFGITVGGVVQWSFRSTGAQMNNNEWTHFTVRQDGVFPTIKRNGVNLSMTQLFNLDITAWFDDITPTSGRIGSFPSGPDTNHMAGSIDEVNHWNRALSDVEILELYNTGGTYDNMSAGLLVGLDYVYNMNADAGTNLVDRIASLVGTPIGLPREAEGPTGAEDTLVNAGDLTANIVSGWDMNDLAGNRNDFFGSNTLTDVNTVGSSNGKVVSDADPSEQIYSVLDQFGNGNNAIQTSFAVQPTITPQGTMSFSSDFLVTDSLLPTITSSSVGTWAAFVKLPAVLGTQHTVISFASLTTNTRLSMRISSAGLLSTIARDNGVNKWDRFTDNQIAFDATWVHVGLVHDGISPLLYVDGVAVAQSETITADKTVWADDLPLTNGRIGCLSLFGFGNFQFLQGEIQQITMYNSVATPLEMSDLSNFNRPV